MKCIPSDGLQLAVETFGSGPPLIMAHGLTGNRNMSRQQLAPLADSYRVIVFDQRGHNESTPVTDPALYDPLRMAADIGNILDAFNVERAIIGGESMGAATALTFALNWPQRVETLLLTAPAFGDKPNPESEGIREMGAAIATVGIEAFLDAAEVKWREELEWPQVVIDHVRAMQSCHDAASLAVACQTVIDWQLFTNLSVVSQLEMPVRIVAWENDDLHPLILAQRMAALIPDVKMTVLASLTEMFSNPAVITIHYRRFLEELGSNND
nr:esterase/lipase [uncultured bacterium]